MKKLPILTLCFLFFSSIQAQLLWKVSGNGLKSPSYLFGTHHLIPISFFDSVPGLYKAFNECDQVVGEIVVNNVDATAKIQQASIMPKHINMKDLLTEEEYKTVDSELKTVLKIGLKEMAILNPTLILTLYELELYKKNYGITDETQSDSYLQLVAIEKGKKVLGLESVEQQIAILFGNGSLQRQADVLVANIHQKDSLLAEMKQLNTLYKTGKLEELHKLSKGKGEITDMTIEEYAKIVDNRNSEWMNKLPSYFKESPTFVAVGALHLSGESGLIKQLQKAGYKVNAIE